MRTQMISLEQIQQETIWVAKMQGYRQVGTYAEVGHLSKDEDCRDFDISCEQPEHLKPFFEAMFKYEEQNGWVTIPEFYEIYAASQEKRTWSESEIKSLIQTNDKVLYGALKKLYDQQTADEKHDGETKEYNGVGFNGADSKFLSSVAEFLNRNGFLTEKQKAVVRKKLVKYTKQLTRLANV